MTSRISPIPAIRLKAGVLIHPLPLSQVLTLAIPLAQIRAVILADHPVANSIEGGASSDIRSMSQHDLLIPVRVRPCELEGLLAQIIYVDLVGVDETAAKKHLLDRVSGLRAKPGEPPSYPRTVGLRGVPNITVAAPLLTEKTSLILYVLRTCPVQIRFGKKRELPI